MNFKHPAMQAAFPPSLTKSANVEGYRPDAEDLAGLYQYRFETAGGLVIQCYLGHQAAEEATDVAPGATEGMPLIWACVGGISVYELLEPGTVSDIEAEALEEARTKAMADDEVMA